MRYIFIISIIMHINVASSQDDKPSWSEELPEMIDAPDLSIDPELDTEIEIDIDDERPNVFDDSIENIDDPNSSHVSQDISVNDSENNSDAEDEAIKQAEIDRIEQEKAAAEKIAQEKLAQERAAADKAAKEKAAAEKAAAEKAAAEKLAKQQEEARRNEISSDLIQSNDDFVIYQWKKVVNVAPDYPSRAARSGEEGWVEVEIELGINGDVVNASVVNSYRNSKTFHREALKAVRQWKYEPPLSFGIEENQFKIVKIVFKL